MTFGLLEYAIIAMTCLLVLLVWVWCQSPDKFAWMDEWFRDANIGLSDDDIAESAEIGTEPHGPREVGWPTFSRDGVQHKNKRREGGK